VTTPLFGADGVPRGFARIRRDTPTWKNADGALCDSHRRMQAMLEAIPVAIVLTDATTDRISCINRRFAELYGED
jgi:PAS domain-containing protein